MTTEKSRSPYQDPALTVEQRVEDLLSRMTVEDKAGLMFQPLAGLGDFEAPGPLGYTSTRTMLDRRINHINILQASTAREIAEWANAVQAEALVVLAPPAGLPKGFDEFHVHLQLMARPLLLIPLPAQRSALVAGGGRQPVHTEPFQDPPHHPRGGDGHAPIDRTRVPSAAIMTDETSRWWPLDLSVASLCPTGIKSADLAPASMRRQQAFSAVRAIVHQYAS